MISKTKLSFFALLCFNFLCLFGRAETANAVSEKECETFGKLIATDLSTGKSDEAVKLLDQFAFVDRIITGFEMNEKDAGDFRAGMFSSLGKGLAQQFKTYSSARFIRVQKIDGESRALIRCLNTAGAVNYLAFVAGRREGGMVRWVDAYTYLSGELLSQTMHRAILPMIAESKKNLLDKLTSGESNYVKYFAQIAQCVELVKSGKNAEALTEFAKLPASLQRERFILIMRLRAAQSKGEPEYLKVITDWEQAYPGDTALNLVSIDGDIMRKNYKQALKHAQALNSQLGGDAYLVYMEGNISFIAGDYASARTYAREALAAEPTLTAAWDVLLNSSISEKKYAETVSILTEFSEKHPKLDIKKVVDETDGYAGFRASPDYEKWAAATAAK